MLNNRLETDALKTASKRAIQNTAEETGDLIGNKIADKITKVSKISPRNSSETEHIKFDRETSTKKKKKDREKRYTYLSKKP